MNKTIAERLAEFVMAMVFVGGIAYVLWQVHRAVLHHAFQVVSR
jgi:cbb3-type cytochrome oxidase subunit 3